MRRDRDGARGDLRTAGSARARPAGGAPRGRGFPARESGFSRDVPRRRAIDAAGDKEVERHEDRGAQGAGPDHGRTGDRRSARWPRSSSSTASRACRWSASAVWCWGWCRRRTSSSGSAAPSRGTAGSSRLLGNGHVDERKLEARTAGDAMTSPAITIGVDRDVSFAARSMTEYGDQAPPGRRRRRRARRDRHPRRSRVRAFARSDEEIEREIDETVLRTLWIEEPASRCGWRTARCGSASFGRRRRSDAELLIRFVSLRARRRLCPLDASVGMGRRRRRDGRRHGALRPR